MDRPSARPQANLSLLRSNYLKFQPRTKMVPCGGCTSFVEKVATTSAHLLVKVYNYKKDLLVGLNVSCGICTYISRWGRGAKQYLLVTLKERQQLLQKLVNLLISV